MHFKPSAEILIVPNQKNKGRSVMTDRPKVNYLQTLLRRCCCRCLALLRSRCWRPSLSLDLRLIDRLCSLAREGGALRHDEELGLSGASIARTGLHTGSVDRLLGFAARQVRLRVHRALG